MAPIREGAFVSVPYVMPGATAQCAFLAWVIAEVAQGSMMPVASTPLTVEPVGGTIHHE